MMTVKGDNRGEIC